MKTVRARALIGSLTASLVVAFIACGLTPHSIHFYDYRSDHMHLTFMVFGPAVVGCSY